MNYRTRNIVTASALGVLAIVLVMMYVSRVRNDEDVGKKLVSVLIAGRDIPEGTPGSALQSGALVKKRVPRKVVVPGWISAPSQVNSEVTTQDILAGEQVSTRKFSSLAATGVRSKIHGYGRVVQLAGDRNQVLDGTLNPGDRVDVLGAWKPIGCDCRVSGVVVRDALVLATATDLPSRDSSSGDDKASVQLRLTDLEATVVFLLEKHGAWWLALRPVVKPRDTKPTATPQLSKILNALQIRGLKE
jgi:Flp pilus assembly protein CpaB